MTMRRLRTPLAAAPSRSTACRGGSDLYMRNGRPLPSRLRAGSSAPTAARPSGSGPGGQSGTFTASTPTAFRFRHLAEHRFRVYPLGGTISTVVTNSPAREFATQVRALFQRNWFERLGLGRSCRTDAGVLRATRSSRTRQPP